MLVVQQALRVRSRKRSPHWLKPAHNAVKMQSFHKTGWATLSLDYIGSLIASTTRPAQLCFLHLELPGCKPNSEMDVPTSSHICQWHQCVKSSPPALACPIPPHRGAKPVSRACTPNCSRVTSTDKGHSACAQESFSPAWFCSTGDAYKCFLVPVISLEIPGASTCIGQGPLPPFSCKQCLGVAQYPSQCHLAWRHLPWTQQVFPPARAPKRYHNPGRKKAFFFYFMKQQQRLWDLGRSQVV